jgi:predicted acylesterase/phospholipase RssA
MKQLFASLLATLLLFGACTTSLSAADLQRRFSIAISGGASKGAYEAGLNWGLLKMMQDIGKIEHILIGKSRTLDAASFSGASAGGINTVLSGLTWCSLPQAEGGLVNTIDDNIFRDVWLVPDINRLLPPTANSIYYRDDDALLARYDLLQASNKLRERWNQPGFRPDCSVPLGVTVTRVVPEEFTVGDIEVQNQRLFIPFVARTRDDGTLGFYFDPNDYPALPDSARILLPAEPDAPPHFIDDQRIEEAVMISSAYPGAFGRRLLQYCRQTSFAETNNEEPDVEQKQQQAIAKLVCPDGYELAEAEFADGGLFDNLPLGLARKLAEQHVHAAENELPVTYVYLDPNRLRYEVPPSADTRACASDNPPEACQVMDFSFFTEHKLLLGALGTARKYELYRELTSEYWSQNLAQLSYELANKLTTTGTRFNCDDDIPFFSTDISCAGAVRRAGALLELGYTRSTLPITPPYSAKQLRTAGIAYDCEFSTNNPTINSEAICKINVVLYRKRLANILLDITENNKQITKEFKQRIHKAKLSMHNDRILRVTDRGAPITGTLLSDFGAFFDLKFREYDYYVGVYDAVVAATQTLCGLKFFEQYQQQEFIQCQNDFAKQVYHAIGIKDDPRGRYVFARLAQWEFEKQNTLRFAYEPLPEEDRDMRIIFDGLIKTLEAGERSEADKQGLFFTENTFFKHLNSEGFTPTPTEDGSTPLLAQIIADPKNWPSELTRRATTRFVYLEQQAEQIFTEREPDPALRESNHTILMGIAAFSLQSATYNYPDFAFAPSTSPENWVWRNIIPYEAAIDLTGSDLIFTWQPTWSLSSKDLLSVRASLGFTGGIVESGDETFDRENYGALGLGYSRRTGTAGISSWGLTPTWYHQWNDPVVGNQDTAGGHVHVSFFKDRLRLGLGVRDVNEASETWFFTVGLTDMPGLTYWLTR